MAVTVNTFGHTADGKEVQEGCLYNSYLEARILTFGATLRSLSVPDKSGRKRDVVLGYTAVAGYETNSGYLGATVGRYANRIAGSVITVEGVEYPLVSNDGKNQCHSGPRGTGPSHRIWTVESVGETEATFTCWSPDGDNGFPGTLKMSVTYRLTERGLCLHYHGWSDKTTPCNMTNHSYFNLDGEGTVLNHWLQLEADAFTPIDEEGIPYGNIEAVQGTPFDFTKGKAVGQDIFAPVPQLKQCAGYDHNFVMRGEGLRRIATVRSGESGIQMEVWSTKPGVQLYTGNKLKPVQWTKSGKPYTPYMGLCLETQYFPDSPHHPEWGAWYLKAGQEYNHITEFRFVD